MENDFKITRIKGGLFLLRKWHELREEPREPRFIFTVFIKDGKPLWRINNSGMEDIRKTSRYFGRCDA